MRPSSIRSVSDALVVSYFASGSRTGLFRQSPVRWEACWMLRNYGGLVDIAKVGAGQCDAMVEVLKGQVSGKKGVVYETRSSPLVSPSLS